MTLSLSLLTALPPTVDSDVHPLSRDADCTSSAKRNVVLPPFGIITTTFSAGGPDRRPGPVSTLTSTSTTATTITATLAATTTTTASNASTHGIWLETNANLDPNPNPDANASHAPAFAAQSRWNGIPIRAIVPLPRRTKLTVGGRAAQDNTNTNTNVTSTRRNIHKPCSARPTHVGDDVDTTDTADEDEGEDAGDGGSDEDGDAITPVPRCCLYESITAANGLSAWSFEELRVECYAQSFVARGAKPPPVVQPSLAIPPAFVPRSVVRSETCQRKK